MKVIELTNRVLFLEDIIQIFEEYTHYYVCTKNGTCEITKNDYFKIKNYLLSLNDEVEVIEEEKKIPEKLEMALLGQGNNWTQKFNKKTKEMETTDIELNPYIIEIITTNTLEIQNTLNQLIDYIKSKGDE